MKLALAVALAALALLGVGACGGDDDDDAPPSVPDITIPKGEADTTTDGGTTTTPGSGSGGATVDPSKPDSPTNDLPPEPDTPEARFELGIDVVGPRRLGRAGLAKLGWSLLVHPTHQRSPDYLYLHDVDRVVVDCDRATPLQVDGEDIGDVAEVVLESERDALTVLV